jgi:hypothetical protein
MEESGDAGAALVAAASLDGEVVAAAPDWLLPWLLSGIDDEAGGVALVAAASLEGEVLAAAPDWLLSGGGALEAVTPLSPLLYSSWAVSEPLGVAPFGVSLASAVVLVVLLAALLLGAVVVALPASALLGVA